MEAIRVERGSVHTVVLSVISQVDTQGVYISF